MDIDDFLDRELNELGLPLNDAEKAQKESTPEQAGSNSDNIDMLQLYENVKTCLSNDNLDEAEKAYVKLWSMFQKQDLKWDKDIFERLVYISRQFSSVLASKYEDVKQKLSKINELISKARSALNAGQNDSAFKIYVQISEINNSLPNIFFAEKRMMQEQIFDLYRDLKNTTDNELVKRVSTLIQDIYNLFASINSAIASNDQQSAVQGYKKLIELYSQIPEGFLRHTNAVGLKILEIYKRLSIHTEISNLQNHLVQKK